MCRLAYANIRGHIRVSQVDLYQTVSKGRRLHVGHEIYLIVN